MAVMTGPNYAFSISASLLISLLAIGVGLSLKGALAGSRQGTLIAGGLSAIVFTFILTAISNWKMMSYGSGAKCGLMEASISLAVAVLYAASIHRVAITITLLFSGIMLFFLSGISHSQYYSNTGGVSSGSTTPASGGHEGKRRK